MRLGLLYEPCPNAFYRAFEPMKAMERRGHQVVWPNAEGRVDLRRLVECDVVHIYRAKGEDLRDLLGRLVRGGMPVTYDIDDDIAGVPRESPSYNSLGKLPGNLAWKRNFELSVQLARLARSLTTTNEVLAEKYRKAGVEQVAVIGNFLAHDALRPRRAHDGIVVGWISAMEHQADLAHINIANALQRLVSKHKSVRVECIGVDLKLPERYRHDRVVPFNDLPGRIDGFDIGIAPLADIPFNHARSDIKLKEYAACGVPWLASPVGPYLGLGEAQGGCLVSNDDWFEALDRLVTHRLKRWRLGRNARAWAKRQTIDVGADQWERVFSQACLGAQRSQVEVRT